MFGKKKKEEDFFDTEDILVVFDDEQRKCDIERVTTISEGKITVAGKFVVPEEDTEVATGSEGRIFFYRAPSQSVRETQRLARLEQSIVLRQITSFHAPNESGMDIQKWILFSLVFVAFIILGMSGCQK